MVDTTKNNNNNKEYIKLSNLSRKIKKSTETANITAQRAKNKHLRRKNAMQGRSLFGSIMDNKIRALNDLPENIRSAYTNSMGVLNLDDVEYSLSICWRPRLGWYPSWTIKEKLIV